MDIFDKFPEDKHYAVLDFNGRTEKDGDDWYVGCKTVDYLVMTYDEVVEWVKKADPKRKYYIIEAEKLCVTIPEPIIGKTFKYEMPEHLKKQRDDVLAQAKEYALNQEKLLNSISDPEVRRHTLEQLKKF